MIVELNPENTPMPTEPVQATLRFVAQLLDDWCADQDYIDQHEGGQLAHAACRHNIATRCAQWNLIRRNLINENP
jgi:hypothetical protein